MPTQQGSGAMTFLLDQIGLGQKQENNQRRSELNNGCSKLEFMCEFQI